MKNHSKTLFVLNMLILAILGSCGGGEKKADSVAIKMPSGYVPEPAATARSESMENVNVPERKVIRKGEISFRTKDTRETSAFITGVVKELEGYIAGDNVYNSGDRSTQRMEIRVPSVHFDDLLKRISENAQTLESKNIEVQDITEEYIDVEARIKTKKELENRYMELLSKAKTVEEILSIEKELGTLRSDIESIEGRLKYLKDQVSFSSLSVEFYQVTGSTFNFSSRFGLALVTGWKWLLEFIIGVVHFWPFILILVTAVLTTLGVTRKKRALRKGA
jgi:hypothetical protein